MSVVCMRLITAQLPGHARPEAWLQSINQCVECTISASYVWLAEVPPGLVSYQVKQLCGSCHVAIWRSLWESHGAFGMVSLHYCVQVRSGVLRIDTSRRHYGIGAYDPLESSRVLLFDCFWEGRSACTLNQEAE